MSWSLIGSRGAHSNAAVAFGTTSVLDTSGANLIHIATCGNTTIQAGAPTSSPANTFTLIQQFDDTLGQSTYLRLYRCENPSTNAAATFTTGNSYEGMAVMVWSGADVPSIDQQTSTGGEGSGSATQPSLTPGFAGELCVSACGIIPSGALAVDGGFTIAVVEANVSFVSYGCALAYLIQTSPAAFAPTWTEGGAVLSTIGASFKVAAAPGGATWPGYIAPFGWN